METKIKNYLDAKSISYSQKHREIIAHCPFNGCDDDSHPGEAHWYINSETGLHKCFKCDEKGNMITLCQHMNDDPSKYGFMETEQIKVDINRKKEPKEKPKVTEELVFECQQDLPDEVSAYLKDRGIPDEIIEQHQLGYVSIYGYVWITIPVRDPYGDLAMLKLHRPPNAPEKQPKAMVYPKGTESTIYGHEVLAQKPDRVIICEGEFDRLVLHANNIPAVTSTNGCKTFKSDWCQWFDGIPEIHICYDNDEPGRKGALQVARHFKDAGYEDVHIVTLPEAVGLGGDITDYFQKEVGTADELFDTYSQPYNEKLESDLLRVVAFKGENPEVKFEDWKSIINDNFPDLSIAAEICLSVVAQILIRDITNPFALVLIDVPSSGKTIVLNLFAELLELVHPTDKFTPASFVSNAANVKKSKLPEIDLLPRIRYKTLIIRDFATLFSKREDDLKDLLGIMTRVLDGEGLSTDTGIHGRREYEGEYLFMMLAASTPITPRVWKIMGTLGGRFFFLSLGTETKSEEVLADQLVSKAYKQKELECRQITSKFLKGLWTKHSKGIDWNTDGDRKEERIIISRCARLLSRLRAVIHVYEDEWSATAYKFSTPVIEKPDRINQLLYNLARGHALACGRENINRDDMKIVLRVCLDSCRRIRSLLFKELLANDGVLQTSQVEEALNCSKNTALKEMEILRILKVVTFVNTGHESPGEQKTIKLRPDLEWFLSDECRALLGLPVITDTPSDSLHQPEMEF